MNRSHGYGVGLILLGAGIATAVVLGPLMSRIIKFRTSANIENQFSGSELVSLVVVAPVVIVAGILSLRGRPEAAAIALAPTLFTIYTYSTAIFGQEYDRYLGNVERAIPLYAALVVGGAVLAAMSWAQVSSQPAQVPPRALRSIAATVLIAGGGLIALAWSAQIRLVLIGRPPIEYLEGPSCFWSIKVLDFGFVIPAAILVGVGLLRGNETACRLSCGLTGFFTCLSGAVAGMAIAMSLKNDPSSSSTLISVLIPVTGGLAVLTIALVRSVVGTSEHDSSTMAAPKAIQTSANRARRVARNAPSPS